MAETTELAVCDSCGQTKKLQEVPHQQEDNDHVWNYCDSCAHVHEVETETQRRLVELNAVDSAAANDPKVVAEIRTEVTKELKAVEKEDK